MTIDALTFDAIGNRIPDDCSSGILDILFRPYLELTLDLTVKIVCIDTVDSLRRCWREAVIPILRAISESLGSVAYSCPK